MTIQNHESGLEVLAVHLGNAVAPTTDLFHQIITNVCKRFLVLKRAGKTAHIEELIAAGAWCDVALALIDIEIPTWSLRRLVLEDSEWFCSLTRQPNLPVALDDTADATHRNLPLAILGAFLEARRRSSLVREDRASTVPQTRPASGNMICCDNFA